MFGTRHGADLSDLTPLSAVPVDGAIVPEHLFQVANPGRQRLHFADAAKYLFKMRGAWGEVSLGNLAVRFFKRLRNE